MHYCCNCISGNLGHININIIVVLPQQLIQTQHLVLLLHNSKKILMACTCNSLQIVILIRSYLELVEESSSSDSGNDFELQRDITASSQQQQQEEQRLQLRGGTER